MILEPEQERLLATLCEASRSAPDGGRQPFFVVQPLGGSDFVLHPGLLAGRHACYYGDLEMLARAGLVLLQRRQTSTQVEITPEGFHYYAALKQQAAEPLKQVQDEVRDYLGSSSFASRFPRAHAKWADAERRLWATDSERDRTTIGHLCREAMQEFASELVAGRPVGADPDPSKVVSRVRAVLDSLSTESSSTVVAFLDALLAYWGTVSDLAQRQEHGGQKEGERLGWEDARRLIFQTAIVMFEVSRATGL